MEMAYVHPGILVIEDSVDLRNGLFEVLRGEGYAAETAATGREALDKLRAGFQPCIILMDLMMPEMNGFEFRTAQLADPELATIPLIAYSGVDDLATHAKQLRANAFIRKPAEISAIMSLVREHCLK